MKIRYRFTYVYSKGQCGKFRLILHYFERTSQDFLQGNVIFERKVVPLENLPTIDEWLNCDAKLCDILVHKKGVIEDAGPSTLQVCTPDLFKSSQVRFLILG